MNRQQGLVGKVNIESYGRPETVVTHVTTVLCVREQADFGYNLYITKKRRHAYDTCT